MPTIYCFGEALVDFCPLSPEATPSSAATPAVDPATPCFRQCAGGAPANAAVAASMFSDRVEFVGAFGTDSFGDFLRRELAGQGVGLAHSLTADAPTALAFVHLDADGERSFGFRRQQSADLCYPALQPAPLPLGEGDILHLCSNLLMEPQCHGFCMQLASRAQSAGALVSFDINYRPALWPDPSEAPSRVAELAAVADLIKFSREELAVLDPNAGSAAEAARGLPGRCLVQTDGAARIEVHVFEPPDAARTLSCQPPTVDAVDTTGAGDAFVGALLVQLQRAALPAVSCLRALCQDPGAHAAKAWLEWAAHCGAATASHMGPTLPNHARQQLPPMPTLKADAGPR